MQTIKQSDIDISDFEESYKELHRELFYDKKQHSHKIEILFNEKGRFSGHIWAANCFYTESDLEKNGDFRCNDLDVELLQSWEIDVLNELEEAISCR